VAHAALQPRAAWCLGCLCPSLAARMREHPQAAGGAGNDSLILVFICSTRQAILPNTARIVAKRREAERAVPQRPASCSAQAPITRLLRRGDAVRGEPQFSKSRDHLIRQMNSADDCGNPAQRQRRGGTRREARNGPRPTGSDCLLAQYA
jgi:hypothetical protein